MPDVVLALTENHVLLSRFASRIATTADRKLRNALFDDLAKALGGHCVALESAVVPMLVRTPRCRLGSSVLVGLLSLKRQLAVLLATDRKTPDFDSGIRRFCDEVEQQADREQLELLPVIRAVLSAEDRAALAVEVTESMRLRLGEHPALRIPLPMLEPPGSPTEEVEEAALILQTLAIPRAAAPSAVAVPADAGHRSAGSALPLGGATA